MKVMSEADLVKAGWVKHGDIWHSPVRKLQNESISESAEERLRKRPPLGKPTISESRAASASAITRKNMVESFQSLGMPLGEAELAAGPER
jgi:hypothetical protein